MRPLDLFLDRPGDRDICNRAPADGLLSPPLHPLSAQRGNAVYHLTHDVTLDSRLTAKPLSREPTDKLLPHLISLPEVICPEDEGVDDTEERNHVRDVVSGLQLVHDHAEAILLCLHALKGKIKVSASHQLRISEEGWDTTGL